MSIASLLIPLLLAAPASSGPGKLAVVPIILGGEESGLGVSDIVSEVSDAAAFRSGLEVMSMEDLFVAGGETALTAVRACGSDGACVAQKLRSVGAELGLLVVVNWMSDPVLLSLRLIGTEKGDVRAEKSGQSPAHARGASVQLNALATEVFEAAGFHKVGRIVVQVSPENASVVVGNERARGMTGNIFTLPAGTYPVRAELEGFEPASTEVQLSVGEEQRVSLMLEEESSLFESPWFWVTVGAVVAGGAAATTAALVSQDQSYCFCVRADGSNCTGC